MLTIVSGHVLRRLAVHCGLHLARNLAVVRGQRMLVLDHLRRLTILLLLIIVAVAVIVSNRAVRCNVRRPLTKLTVRVSVLVHILTDFE